MKTTTNYRCDCDATDERHDYKVTGHDGSVTICSYCPDCYELALIDWNGETAKVEEIPEPLCTCSKCGKAYDRAAWEALPGTDGGGKEWVFSAWDMLEIRNCPCGGTMGLCPIPAVLQVAS